jgi:hypothetical protein
MTHRLSRQLDVAAQKVKDIRGRFEPEPEQ